MTIKSNANANKIRPENGLKSSSVLGMGVFRGGPRFCQTTCTICVE